MYYYKNYTTNAVHAFQDAPEQIPDGFVEVTYLEFTGQSVPDKNELLNSITVTTQSGKTFDGNETARNNMMSAIMAADVVGQTESDWKLADNTVSNITLGELKEALALSIQRVGEIVLSS